MNQVSSPDREKVIQIVKAGILPEKTLEMPIDGFSMYPFIKPGSKVILSTRIIPSQILIGDIIAIVHQNFIVAHRVIFIWKERETPFLFLTKGDGNKIFDTPVRPDQVLGKIVGFQKNDKYINLNQPSWRLAGFWIAAGSGVFGRLYKYINHFFSETKNLTKTGRWLMKPVSILQFFYFFIINFLTFIYQHL